MEPGPDDVLLGKRIQQARLAKDWTPEALAKLLHYKRTTIVGWEKGTHKVPYPALVMITMLTGYDVGDLVETEPLLAGVPLTTIEPMKPGVEAELRGQMGELVLAVKKLTKRAAAQDASIRQLRKRPPNPSAEGKG